VAAGALYAPQAFGIGRDRRDFHKPSRCSRWALGVAIGAITFTGSVIAFCQARRTHVRQADHAAPAPPHQRAAGRRCLVLLIALFMRRRKSKAIFWLIVIRRAGARRA
jgi:NAD/NADP transhydrogenase beta subunit